MVRGVDVWLDHTDWKLSKSVTDSKGHVVITCGSLWNGVCVKPSFGVKEVRFLEVQSESTL